MLRFEIVSAVLVQLFGKDPTATGFAHATPERRNSDKMSTKCLGVFGSIITVTVRRSSSPEVCHVHSGSLEASRSRVGIVERDDILWFRRIVGS